MPLSSPPVSVRIYALADPRDGRVRYVGRTVMRLARRLGSHISSASRSKMVDKSKEAWIRDLAGQGMKPEILELAVCGADSFREEEKKWIATYRGSHPDLLNLRCGGDGFLGGDRKEWTAEADSMLGVVSDSDVAKLMGLTRKAVSYRREQRGIPASVSRANSKPPPAMGGHNKIPLSAEVLGRLGKEPDHLIARDLGVNKSMIARRRRSLGIDAFGSAADRSGRFTKGAPHPRWGK